MPKAKLKIDSNLKEVFEIACEAEDIEVVEVKKFGGSTKAEINYKNAAQLFALGQAYIKDQDDLGSDFEVE